MSKKTKNRYTDKELESFRKIINEKIVKAKTELDILKIIAMSDILVTAFSTTSDFYSYCYYYYYYCYYYCYKYY